MQPEANNKRHMRKSGTTSVGTTAFSPRFAAVLKVLLFLLMIALVLVFSFFHYQNIKQRQKATLENTILSFVDEEISKGPESDYFTSYPFPYDTSYALLLSGELGYTEIAPYSYQEYDHTLVPWNGGDLERFFVLFSDNVPICLLTGSDTKILRIVNLEVLRTHSAPFAIVVRDYYPNSFYGSIYLMTSDREFYLLDAMRSSQEAILAQEQSMDSISFIPPLPAVILR